ncbi:MAG: Maf family protein [Clostridia bacterium]|nr:Maf family protein [Clostridia bacterium]
MKIILASASPRRRELLSQIVKDFEIIPAKGEECADNSLPPERIAERLAENKCGEVFEKNNGALVIGCDTIVVYNGVILGKPRSAEDAVSTLKMLSGRTHSVITGVCVRCGNKKITASERTEVRFNDLSEDFIKTYVAGGSPMDKAGSYGIQDGGVVKSYSGSYTNVVGLPVELVKKIIEEVR